LRRVRSKFFVVPAGRLRLARVASVEFDREMAAHRAHLATTHIDILDDVQFDKLADLAVHQFLADDEKFRAVELCIR
jgi:hypothetical protein